MHDRLTGDSKLSWGVSMSMDGCLSCLSLCGPVMDWRPVRGVPRLSPNDSWNRLQPPPRPCIWLSRYRKWMGRSKWNHKHFNHKQKDDFHFSKALKIVSQTMTVNEDTNCAFQNITDTMLPYGNNFMLSVNKKGKQSKHILMKKGIFLDHRCCAYSASDLYFNFQTLRPVIVNMHVQLKRKCRQYIFKYNTKPINLRANIDMSLKHREAVRRGDPFTLDDV